MRYMVQWFTLLDNKVHIIDTDTVNITKITRKTLFDT